MRAFSLAEFLVSLGIMAMALVALFNLAGSAVKMSSKTENLAIAGDIAELQMNKEVRLALLDQPPGAREEFWNGDFASLPWREGKVTVNNTEFKYEIFALTVMDSQTGKPLGQELTTENRVKKVEIVIWWMTSEADRERQGYGRLSTSATRLFNEEPLEK